MYMYSVETELIHDNQAGFEKGFTTLDYILNLYFLSNTLMKCRKKLFRTFFMKRILHKRIGHQAMPMKVLFKGSMLQA